ncbi:DMT family transporter [Streptomyces ovatisporus]|uniref:DMT family transporter n=1 Tax=Streptomyces ovatisporus TaxID=1128682 RepID=A0ABV9AI60_9ACTN
MVYVTLIGAILAEVVGTTAMKYSDGFSRLWPSLVTAASYTIAFVLLAQTLKTMAVGTTYAIWSGVGTAAIAVIGVVFIGEAVTAAKVAGILLVILGVMLLNLGSVH